MARSGQVKPDDKGYITVKINTAGRKGQIVENVDVLCNAAPEVPLVLTIRAFVTEPLLPFFPGN